MTPPVMLKRKLQNGSSQTLMEGAIYDQDFHLIKASQRLGTGVFLNDSPLLRFNKSRLKKIEDREFLYLGNFFQQYGHFLLETLPMLSYLLEDRTSQAIFNELPFGSVGQEKVIFRRGSHSEFRVHTKTDFGLIKAACKMLDISMNRIHINKSSHIRFDRSGQFIDVEEKSCLEADFLVAPRPVFMEKKLLNISAYKTILDKLWSSVSVSNCAYGTKIFVLREPKFFSKSTQDEIANFFKLHGFSIVNPLDYSFEEQVLIFSKARIVVGFSGSSLHNSIFSKSLELIIEIGRNGVLKNNPNQKICADISASSLVFCKNDCVDEMKNTLIGLIKNI